MTTKTLAIEDIERVVETFFDLKKTDLHSKSKTRRIALARRIAMYLARKHTDLSFPVIGGAMEKDHSTVVLACQKIGAVLEGNERVSWQTSSGSCSANLRSLIETLEQQLGL